LQARKTAVKDKTLNPTWMEEFEFTISASQRQVGNPSLFYLAHFVRPGSVLLEKSTGLCFAPKMTNSLRTPYMSHWD